MFKNSKFENKFRQTKKIKSMKFAAIDIGSNAARLQISSYLEDGSFKKVEYVRFALRLGHDVFNYNRITAESEVRIFKLLNAFKMLMELHEVKDYHICATSAMREAENSADIVTRIHKILEMRIHIIEGTKEAELINRVVVKFMDPEKNYIHIDVGGGSTEINIYQKQEKVASKSFKIGSVRLLEGREKVGDWEKMHQWIERQITLVPGKFSSIGTGGNINKLFDVLPNEGPDKIISLEEMKSRLSYIESLGIRERINQLRMNADRADVIVPASKIYILAMEAARANEMVVPDVGLKDGILELVLQRYKNRIVNSE